MTLPELKKSYYETRRKMIVRCAKKRMTQAEAALALGVTRTCLNNIIKREKIAWPVIRQGVKTKDISA